MSSDLPPPEQIRAAGVALSVRRLPARGEAAGAARRMIAFHGGPGLDHHVLLPLADHLRARYEVWLPDLPGHGGSVAPSGKLPGLPAMERALASWLNGLDGLGARDDLLLGHSLGAWLLVRLLRRGRVSPRAAVLLSPPAAGQARSTTALRRAVLAMGLPEPGPRSGRTSERARRELRAHVEAETRGAAGRPFLRAVERVDVRDPRLYRALLRNFHRAVTGPVRPFAPECPVLVLCGEEDRTTPPGQARTVAGSIAGARLELLPGAGHYPFAERPAETARRILDFLGPPV